MTLDEFFDALNKIKGWYNYHGTIRRKSKIGVQCPLTAVCYAKTGLIYDESRTYWASKAIGLSVANTNRIVFASDDPFYAKHSIRERLLETLNLTETETNR